MNWNRFTPTAEANESEIRDAYGNAIFAYVNLHEEFEMPTIAKCGSLTNSEAKAAWESKYSHAICRLALLVEESVKDIQAIVKAEAERKFGE